MKEVYNGGSYRQRTSFAREFDWIQRTILAGETFSDCIPFNMSAGIAIICPTMTGTHVALYGSFELDGVPQPIYDEGGTHLVVAVQEGIISLPVDLLPIGFLYLASASAAAGTLEVEVAEVKFVVMLKP